MTAVKKGVDFAYLARRVQAHELARRGLDIDEIAAMMELPIKNLRRYIRMPIPKLEQAARNQTWREDALCKESDTDLFFPKARGRYARNTKRKAMQICARCPVQRQCLATAMANYESHGVWGGRDFSKYAYVFDEATGEVTRIYCDENQKIS